MTQTAPGRAPRRSSPPRTKWIVAIFLIVALALGVLHFAFPQILATAGDDLTDFVEPYFGLGQLVYLGISILSAPVERSLLFVGVLVAMTLITIGVPRVLSMLGVSRPPLVAAVRIAVVWLFLSALFLVFRPIDPTYAAIVWTNSLALIPAHILAVAYAAMLFLMPRILSAVLGGGPRWSQVGALLSALMVAVVAALVPHGERLLRASLLVYPEPAVRILPTASKENLSGINLDPVHDRVLVSGHSTDHLLVYDLGNIGAEPRMSEAETGMAQNFALNPARNEAYVYNGPKNELVVIDTATLEAKKRIGHIDLSIGDPILAWDDAGRVVIASEGPHDIDGPVENAFVVVDIESGTVVARHAEAVGESVYYDARRGLMFATNFREKRDIVVYDLALDQFTRRAPMPTKRMTMIDVDPTNGDLLVAFPLESRIVRLNPESLEIKGEIPAMLGARKFAFDLDRGLLVVMSLLAGVAVMDLETEEILATYRLPQPWLRNMVIDTERGQAYVTGRHGLYQVDYTARVPKSHGMAN